MIYCFSFVGEGTLFGTKKWGVTICTAEHLMIPYQEMKGGHITICIRAVSGTQKSGALGEVNERATFCRGKKEFHNQRGNNNRRMRNLLTCKWEQDYSTQRGRKARGMFR